MSQNAKLELRLNTAALSQANDALFETVKEVFEIDMKTDAVRMSPVSPGRWQGGSYYGGGTNKRSIDTEVEKTPAGVLASLFTQSGYGGYLELGTRYMRARPYIFPAFDQNKSKLMDVLRVKIAAIAVVRRNQA